MLELQDGVVTWRRAVELLSVGRVRGLLRSGRWRRYGRGVLVAHNGPVTRAQAEWAAVLESGDGALLAGITAARLCGLRWYDDAPIDILVPATRKLTPRTRTMPASPGTATRSAGSGAAGRPGSAARSATAQSATAGSAAAGAEAAPVVRIHRTGVMAPQDALPRGRPPQTTAARSIVDAAQWAGTDRQARTIVAAGIQQRLTAADELTDVLARMPRAHRRALIAEVVSDAAGGSHSLPERQFLQLCRRYRLPLPDRQVPRRDSTGRRRWLDAYWKEWRLHVEIDGGQHMDVRAWWSDMRRQNSLWVAGDRVLRFPSWAIRHHPHDVATQLMSALTTAGWPGSP